MKTSPVRRARVAMAGLTATPRLPSWPLAAALLTAIALASTMLVPGSAAAYSVTTVTSNSKTVKRYFDGKIPYLISSTGSDDLPLQTVRDILKKGFEGWMAPSCTALEFVEGYHCNTAIGKCLYDKNVGCKSDADCPASSSVKVMPLGYNPNGRNELVFAENSVWKHGSYVLGVTVAWANNWQGAIAESDIAFNGYLQKWTTDPNKAGNGTQHLLSVAIHEQGHFFGVMHVLGGWSQSDPPTMAPNVMPYGLSATLNPDDQKAACFLNPAGGKHSCKSDADCPYVVHKSQSTGKESYTAKLSCKSGSCVFAGAATGGSKPLGGDCVSDAECSASLFCQPVSGGQGYCAITCAVSKANCPSGFVCYPYQSGNDTGVCLKPLGGSGATKDIGQACGSSGECKSLLCAGGACAQPCTVGTTGQCPSSEICESLPGGGGACVAKSEPSLKDISEECYAPEECASGVCMKNDLQATVGYCRLVCTAPGSCPDGFKCVSQGEGYTGCIPGKESIASGQPCQKDDVCAGGLCVPAGDAGSVCSNTCDPGDPASCPCGMVCADGVKGKACYLGKPVGCLLDGAPCSADAECESAVCKQGACQPGCVVGGAAICAQGYGCLRVSAATSKGFCEARGKVEDGNFCVADSVCASLFCAKDADGVPRCSRACAPGAADSCPEGAGCVEVAAGVGRCVAGQGGGGGGAQDAGTTADGVTGGQDAGAPAAVPGNFQPATPSGCTAAPVSSGAAGAGWLALLGLAAAMLGRRRRRDPA